MEYTESTYDKYWKTKGEYGLERIRRKKIRKEKRIAKMRTCPKCGGTDREVKVMIDPYMKEMTGDDYYVKMCWSCFEAACGDI